jgi:hypothetical protein
MPDPILTLHSTALSGHVHRVMLLRILVDKI